MIPGSQSKIYKSKFSSIYSSSKIINKNENSNEYVLQFNKKQIQLSDYENVIQQFKSKKNTLSEEKSDDIVYKKFVKLYKRYKLLFVTDEDQIKKKKKNGLLDFIEQYALKSNDLRLNIVSKCKFLLQYARTNIKFFKNDMIKAGVRNPEKKILYFQDELFDFINENYILFQKIEKSEFLNFIN